jgi:hypothetical protein
MAPPKAEISYADLCCFVLVGVQDLPPAEFFLVRDGHGTFAMSTASLPIIVASHRELH